MKRSTQIGVTSGLVAVAAALGIAVVNRRATNAELERRLALASDSTALDLALQSRNRTRFVSALERNDAETAPAPSPARINRTTVRRPARAIPVESPTRARVAAPQAAEVATNETAPTSSPLPESAPAPIEATSEAAPAPAPSPDHIPAPRPTPSRKGGYWSTADVIRNAPFPINP